MPLPNRFYATDGEEIGLVALCRNEPEWAASRIRHLTKEVDDLKALQQTNAADGRIECICGGRNLPDAKHCWKCRGMIVPARR